MKTIIKYTLLTASRDLLFIGLCAIIFMAYGFSVFVGNTALVEQSQMSMAYFAGSSRIILVTGLIVFVCFHVRRSFDNREVESILSKPISRTQFVVAYWLGFCVLALASLLPVIFIMTFLNKPDLMGLIMWSASLALETSIIIAFAMLSSLIMKSAVSSVLSSFSFYLISRLMGFFIATMETPGSLMSAGKLGGVLESILKIVAVILPRLDLFAKSEWLIYGTSGQEDLWVFPVQAIVFILLLLSVSIFDFKRKQF
jgi:ABC-type transport system involved in multi-copper enzyme maturation permease subunit